MWMQWPDGADLSTLSLAIDHTVSVPPGSAGMNIIDGFFANGHHYAMGVDGLGNAIVLQDSASYLTYAGGAFQAITFENGHVYTLGTDNAGQYCYFVDNTATGIVIPGMTNVGDII